MQLNFTIYIKCTVKKKKVLNFLIDIDKNVTSCGIACRRTIESPFQLPVTYQPRDIIPFPCNIPISRYDEFMQTGNIYLKILLLRIFQHTCIPIYRVDTLHVASHHLDAGLFRLVMIEERVIRL